MKTLKEYPLFWSLVAIGVTLFALCAVCQVWASLDVMTVAFTIAALYWVGFAIFVVYAEKMQDAYVKHTREQASVIAPRDQICHVSTEQSTLE